MEVNAGKGLVWKLGGRRRRGWVASRVRGGGDERDPFLAGW